MDPSTGALERLRCIPLSISATLGDGGELEVGDDRETRDP